MNDKKLIIITNFDHQRLNGAAYNRLANYSSLLADKGIKVVVYSTRYNYSYTIKEISAGAYTFLYTENKYSNKTTFADLEFYKIFKFYKILNQHYKENEKKNVAILIYSHELPVVFFGYVLLKKKYKYRVFIEKNEIKVAIILNRNLNNTNIFKFLLSFLFKYIEVGLGVLIDVLTFKYDGIIAISSSIYDLYKRKNNNILQIPILAKDIDVSNYKKSDDSLFKIGYFGWISEKKDGVFSLIESVIGIKNIYQNKKIRLDIFGNGDRISIKKIKALNLRYIEINFLGQCSARHVALTLREYDLLAFPRPLNMQTKYGFSTKLAEFMLSGVPVLTSDVSDNAVFINDNVNGFLIEGVRRNDKKKLQAKIIEICNKNSNELHKIGEAGRVTAIEKFSPKMYSDNMIMFLWN